MNIHEISELIRTQSNRGTDQPMFVVQREVKDCGYSSEYAEDYDWFNSELVEVADEELSEELDELENMGDAPDEWEKVYYKTRWEFVTACLTEKGCQDYIDSNGHNIGKSRIYGYGSYRNSEYQDVRKYLMELEQGIDSQAILAAAKELGRVEVLEQMQALQGHSWELEFLDGGVRWWHYFNNSLSVIETGNDSESLLAYLDSRGELDK